MELAEKIKASLIEDALPVIRRSPYEPFKRLFDFCFAVVLLPFLLPLMGLIAVLIKMDSQGPVLFSGIRIGKSGRRFNCYKFRTMVENAEEMLSDLLKDSDVKREWKKNIKLKNDPRITSIGFFLRKFSLDELPQIFNVLKGDMSFVGPRPILEEEVVKYGSFIETYESQRPGITGLWQISGRNDSDYSQRIRLMIDYLERINPVLDLKIILKTLPAVLSRRGAY